MVMGSIFDTPTDEEDQNPPQPQPPPPQDPLAQQPTQDQIDSLNHAQGVVQQGLQTVTNMFGPQAQQTADQNSINQAQNLVGGALQGIQTVGNAVDQDQASANQRLAQVTGGMGQDPLSRGISQVGPAMNWAQNNVLNQVPIPGAPVIQGINALSNQLGGPQVLPTPNVGGVMQAANLPAEQLPNIPGFSSQPQIAQQFEQGAVGAAPYVLGGPESALGKAASIGLGGLGSVADQNLGTQLGPLGLGQLLGMGLPGLFDRGPRPEIPTAQPEPVQTPNTTMAPVSTSTTSSYREPAETPAFYHETSPENARSILTEGRVSNDLSGRGVYVSDSPDLALGQSGKGAMVVLDPAKTEVQAVRPLGQSPEMAQQLGTNYITNRTTSGAVREVRFSADAIRSDPTVRGMVAYAQRGQVTPLTRGFDFQMNPDGSASWTRKGETTTTAPTSITTTSGGNYWDTTGIGPKIEAEQQRGPYIQWINENIHPDEQRVYKAALADVLAGKQAQAPTPEGTLGPDPQTNPYRTAHDSIRQNLAPDMPYLAAPPPGSGATETPFRAYPGAPREAAPAGEPAQPAGNMVFAEGHDGNIHTITGFNGIRDGQQWFQTETGEVPLSLLKNLSSGDLAELGRMRTAAGGMPPNTPNAQPITGQPNSPGAQGFQQSPAGQQFAGQGAAGMNVTQPGVSSSNAAPSTTYGGGAGGITGQAPPAGREPPSGGGRGRGGTPYDSSRNSTVGLLQQLQDISGLPMALKVDAHLPLLRQGAASIFSDPEAAFKGMDAGIKSFVSQEGADAAMQAVHDLPTYNLAKASGLFESQHGPNVAPSQRESFQEYRGSGKTLASQLTGLVPLAENTGRGYSAEMNTTRFLRFEHVAQNMLDAGLTPGENPRAFRALADAINNQTGHGPIGQGSVPLFFSMPALSGRVAMWTDLITKLGNPLQAGAYQEVIKGALSQAALGASMLGLAAAGGATIKQESSGGLPIAQWAGKLGTQIFDPWAGQNAIVKLVLNSVKIIGNDQLSDGDIRDQLKDTYLKFARGELGPLQGKIVDVVTGKDYNGNAIPGNGVLGRINTLAKDPDQWINFVAPFWADSIYNGAKAFGLGGGLRGLPSFLGGSVTTYQNSAAGQAHFDATNPEHLQQAFPNAPVMQGILQGKQWNELLPNEKSAITKTLDPKVVSEIKAEQRQQNPAFAQHSDAVDYLTQKKNAAENELLDRYNAGTLDGPHTANLLKAVQADYYTTKDKVDNDPAFKAEVAKLPANTNSAQAALDGYYKIPDKAGRDQYIQWLASQSPQLAARIATAVQPQNQTKLELMYANGELR